MLVWARCFKRTMVVVGRSPMDVHPGWEIQVTEEELARHSDALERLPEPEPADPTPADVIVLEDDDEP